MGGTQRGDLFSDGGKCKSLLDVEVTTATIDYRVWRLTAGIIHLVVYCYVADIWAGDGRG